MDMDMDIKSVTQNNGYSSKLFHSKLFSKTEEIQNQINSNLVKESMELYLCTDKIRILGSHYSNLIKETTKNTETSKIQSSYEAASKIYDSFKNLLDSIKGQQISIADLNENINHIYSSILFARNMLKTKTLNENTTMEEMTLKPLNFKERQEIMETQESFEFNLKEKSRIHLNLFFKKNKKSIKAVAFWSIVIFALFQAFQAIKSSNETHNLEIKSLSTPTEVYEIMKHSNAISFEFLPMVIYLHNLQKSYTPENRWDIFYDEKRKAITLNKKVNPEQCKSLVALKEINFDSSTMKVNKMILPMNYWTGSTSENWPQTTNNSLCSLPENETSITIQFANTKSELYREIKYQPKEIRFLINQHKIAAGMHNNEIVSNSLTKKLNELEQSLEKATKETVK